MVNQEQNQNHSETSVAWYKLATLIARREREKALSVYRLLSHSFQDKAYALQLEGDILNSLDDQGAHDKYKQAAFLYKKEKRWIDAVAVCNHLLTLDPYNPEMLATSLSLYILAEWKDRFDQQIKTVLLFGQVLGLGTADGKKCCF